MTAPMTPARERAVLLRSVGIALVVMHEIDAGIAGRYLDTLIEHALISTEQGLVLMDALKERTEGTTR